MNPSFTGSEPNKSNMHFPLKLYEIVEDGPPDIIAWSGTGKSFLVVNVDDFCNKVVRSVSEPFRHSQDPTFLPLCLIPG